MTRVWFREMRCPFSVKFCTFTLAFLCVYSFAVQRCRWCRTGDQDSITRMCAPTQIIHIARAMLDMRSVPRARVFDECVMEFVDVLHIWTPNCCGCMSNVALGARGCPRVSVCVQNPPKTTPLTHHDGSCMCCARTSDLGFACAT